MIKNAITIDVEDYFHTEAMSDVAPRDKWESFPSRVERNTELLFELFARHNVRATFFFLGWVAERNPRLVTDAVRLGHEVGCHSYWHRAVFRLTPDEFREDTHRSKSIIEDIAGVAVHGYRAPSFSITPAVPWAYDVLSDLGFTYDSSVNPINHPFYGNPTAPRCMHAVNGSDIKEIPIATIRLRGTNFPVGGGAYLRVLPYSVFRMGIRRINRSEQMPAMMYLHPWEVDPDQPRLPGRLTSRMRQYVGLAGMAGKLESLLRDFEFGSAADLIEQSSLASVATA